MACYNVEIQQTAIDEFDLIVEHLTTYSEKAALKFRDEWNSCIASLEDGIVEPGLSRFENLGGAGYHSVFFGDYVLLFFNTDDTKTIAHIFHQKQDYANLV